MCASAAVGSAVPLVEVTVAVVKLRGGNKIPITESASEKKSVCFFREGNIIKLYNAGALSIVLKRALILQNYYQTED